MRLLHMTDVHFLSLALSRGSLGKRSLGLLNLFLRGRRHYFDADRLVPEAVQDALGHAPDLFCLTGDITALSQEVEFAAARAAFAPLLDCLPSVVVPGNHDVYTTGAAKGDRFGRHFGGFHGGPEWPGSVRVGEVEVIATNPCRPSLRADGRFPDGAIAAAEELVRRARAAGRVVVYLVHYPILEQDGEPYRDDGHCLLDLDPLLESLRRAPPHLLLHGHKHTAYRQRLLADDGSVVTILGGGSSSALSPRPDRAAGYFLVDLDAEGVSRVERRCRQADGSFVRDEALSDPV